MNLSSQQVRSSYWSLTPFPHANIWFQENSHLEDDYRKEMISLFLSLSLSSSLTSRLKQKCVLLNVNGCYATLIWSQINFREYEIKQS
jgi:hypothetical protein